MILQECLKAGGLTAQAKGILPLILRRKILQKMQAYVDA